MKNRFSMIVMVIMLLILHASICFSASSVMIIARKSQTQGALASNTAPVKAAVQRIASYFTDKGIGVFDEDAMNDVYAEIEQTSRIDIGDNDLIALALQKHAEVLVILEVFTINVARGDESASARASAKMFNVSNGRLFAMSEQYGQNVIPSHSAIQSAQIAAASKAGARVGKRLLSKLEKNHPKILARLIRNDTPGYIIIFSGFGESENDDIIDAFYDDLGLEENNIREKKVAQGYVELEVFTTHKFGRFTRKIKRIMRSKGIVIHEKFRDAGKVTYVKEGKGLGQGKINIHD